MQVGDMKTWFKAIEPQGEESQMDQSKNRGVAGAGLREDPGTHPGGPCGGWLRKGISF